MKYLNDDLKENEDDNIFLQVLNEEMSKEKSLEQSTSKKPGVFQTIETGLKKLSNEILSSRF